MPSLFQPTDLASVLPPDGRTLVAGASGESLLLAEAVAVAGDLLGAMTFTGIFVPGLNRRTYLANPGCRVETFFMTPELKAAANAVDFLPLSYSDILTRLSTIKIDAALMMVAPPDENGLCSFGPCVDFLAELWPSIPVRIAHINPLMPVTRGHAGIPLSVITAFVEGEQPLLGDAEGGSDPAADAIASHIAPFVPNGATLQTGVGQSAWRCVARVDRASKSPHPFRADRRCCHRPRSGRSTGQRSRNHGRRRYWFRPAISRCDWFGLSVPARVSHSWR